MLSERTPIRTCKSSGDLERLHTTFSNDNSDSRSPTPPQPFPAPQPTQQPVPAILNDIGVYDSLSPDSLGSHSPSHAFEVPPNDNNNTILPETKLATVTIDSAPVDGVDGGHNLASSGTSDDWCSWVGLTCWCGCVEIRLKHLLIGLALILGLGCPVLLALIFSRYYIDAIAFGVTCDAVVYPGLLFVYSVQTRLYYVPGTTLWDALRHNMYRILIPYGFIALAVLLATVFSFTLPSVFARPAAWLLVMYGTELVALSAFCVVYFCCCLY